MKGYQWRIAEDNQLSSAATNSFHNDTINDDNGYIDEDLKSQLTKCQCPKCGIGHAIKMPWAGTGMLCKFCIRCKNKIDRSVKHHCHGSNLTSLFDAD